MLFEHPAAERIERAKAVMHAIGVLRSLQAPAPAPQVSDDIGPSTQRSQRVVVRMAAGGNVAESN